MRDGHAIPASARPRLAQGVRLVHSEPHGGWVLLAPERMLKTDAVAADILGRCDGAASLHEIVDDLAARFDAPRERIAGDVNVLLASLAEKKLVEFSDA